jgi:integrase/recombinase XerD
LNLKNEREDKFILITQHSFRKEHAMFYIEDFIASLKAKNLDYKKTIARYRSMTEEFRVFCVLKNITSVTQITDNTVSGYLDYLKKHMPSENMMCLNVYVLRSYLRFLYEQGRVFFQFLDDFHIPKSVKHHYPVFSKRQIEHIIENIKSKDKVCIRAHAMLELMYSSALRPSEVCRLKIADIDFNTGILFIRKSKRRKDRIVPISEHALDVISRYIKGVRKQYLKTGSPDNVFLCFGRPKPLDIQSLRYTILQALKRNGLPPLKPYSLRATAATVLFLNGMSTAYLSKLLGHEEIDTTRVYVRVNQRNLQKVLDASHPRSKINNRRKIS